VLAVVEGGRSVSGLWTNDRDTLADILIAELDWVHAPDLKWTAGRLIGTGAVRVLDPDDTELVERVARGLFLEAHPGSEAGWDAPGVMGKAAWYTRARAVIKVLRQP
jgi:hypothetical protein